MKDNLSPVENGSKRIYKMYKSKKNWVVAPVVLLTLLGAVAPAPIALTNVVNAEETSTASSKATDAQIADALIAIAPLNETNSEFKTAYATAKTKIEKENATTSEVEEAVTEAYTSVKYESNLDNLRTTAKDKITSGLTDLEISNFKTEVDAVKVASTTENQTLEDADVKITAKTPVQSYDEFRNEYRNLVSRVDDFKSSLNDIVAKYAALVELNKTNQSRYDDAVTKINASTVLTADEKKTALTNLETEFKKVEANKAATTFADKADAAIKIAAEGAQNYTYNKLVAEFDTTTGLLKDATGLSSETVYNQFKDDYKAAVDAKDVTKLLALEQAYWKDYASTIANAKTASGQAVAWGSYYTNKDSEKTALVNYYLNKVAEVELSHNATADTNAVNNVIGSSSDFATDKQFTNMGSYTIEDTVLDSYKENIKVLPFGDYLTQLKARDFANPLAYRQFVDSIATEAKNNLESEKATALETVKADTTLSDAAKTDLIAKVSNATEVGYATPTKVNTIKQLLSTLVVDELAAYKTETINELKAIKPTVSQATLDEINSKTSKLQVDQRLYVAFDAIYKNATGVTVDDATKVVNALKDLTFDQLADYKTKLRAAKTAADRLTVLKEAIETAKKVNTLEVNRESALNYLNANKTLLTPAQVEDFTTKIKAAKDMTELEKVYKGDNTGTLEKAVKTASDLANYKTDHINGNVTKQIDGLREASKFPNLTSDQLKSFIDRVNAATTTSEIDNIMAEAKKANLDGYTKLSDYVAKAKDAIESLGNLKPDQKAAFKTELAAAKDLAAAKAVYADALAKDQKVADADLVKKLQEMYDAARYNEGLDNAKDLHDATLKADWTKKFQDAVDLANEKVKALEAIRTADFLTAAQKEALTKEVNDAKTIADVKTVEAKIDQKAPATVVQLYRAYNPNSGEHLYTSDKSEYDHLVSLGWKGEGDAWKAASKGAPVYRLYNPNSGEHFYTTNELEYNNVAKAGWTKEGVAFYSDENKGVEVYRLFNPNAKGAGSHHFTTSASERDDLIKAGWKYENVAFYGLK